MVYRRITWGDLVSPRAMWSFTFEDAWTAIPTLLAMGGLFIASIAALYIVKKFIFWMLTKFRRCGTHNSHKWLLKKEEMVGGKIKKKTWDQSEKRTHRIFNIIHLVIETFFFVGIVAAALFACAVGDVNVWQSPVAISVIGIVITYIFGAGLQQAGSGYFFFMNNCMSPGEWWQQVGGGIRGRVSNITPFFVEFETKNPKTGGALLQRAPMTLVLGGIWERDYAAEDMEDPVFADDIEYQRSKPPQPSHRGDAKQITPASAASILKMV